MENKRTGETLGQISLSIGIAEFNGDDSAQVMLERAEKALGIAKKEGRNRVVTQDRLSA